MKWIAREPTPAEIDAMCKELPEHGDTAGARIMCKAMRRAMWDAAPQVDGVPRPVAFELLEMSGEGGRTYYRVSMKRGDSVATVQGTYHKPSALKMLEEWQRRFGDGPAAAAPQPAQAREVLAVEQIIDLAKQWFSFEQAKFGNGTTIKGGVGSLIEFAHAVRARPSLTDRPGFIRPHLNGQAVYVNWSGTRDELNEAIDAALSAHTNEGAHET
jgi:hypothetical protein